MQEWLDAFNLGVNSLHSAPTYAVGVSCFVVGYVVKTLKRVDNSAIPLLVVLWGALANALLSNEHGPSLTLMQEKFLAGLIGMAIGFVAWIIHRKGLKRIEDKIPFLRGLLSNGDTETIEKPKE